MHSALMGGGGVVIVSMYSDVVGREIWFFQKYNREQGSLPDISSDYSMYLL